MKTTGGEGGATSSDTGMDWRLQKKNTTIKMSPSTYILISPFYKELHYKTMLRGLKSYQVIVSLLNIIIMLTSASR